MSSLGRPLHMIRPDGIPKHVFQVDVETAVKLSQRCRIKFTIDSNRNPIFFGTITENQNGCLEIWELLRFCRPLIKIPTTFGNCSWATVTLIDEQVRFLIYSREAGLCISSITDNPIEDSDFCILDIPNRPHVGFCLPIFKSLSNEVTVFNSDDNLVNISLETLSCQVYKLEGITHMTFIKGFQKNVNMFLIGSESGKISLIDTSKFNPRILSQVDLIKNELVEAGKKKCRDSSDDNVAIPLCCDGDESIGIFVVGTRANVIVLITIQFNDDIDKNRLSVTSVKGIPNPGVNSVVIHPNKKMILVTTWDAKVRIFTFPNLDFIQSIEWSLYPQIGVVTFVQKVNQDSSISYFLILASNTQNFTIWNFDITNALLSK